MKKKKKETNNAYKNKKEKIDGKKERERNKA